MILYGSALSPFVRKVSVLASEKGMTLEMKTIGLGSDDPAFLAASPLRKMPALQDGDYTLADSTAICVYLDAVGPGPKLIPDEPQARGTAFWWDEFADTELFRHAQPIFFNRIVVPLFMKRTGDMAAADAAARDGLPPLLAYVERAVPADGYLQGPEPTLADIAIGSVFVNLLHVGHAPDPATQPRTAAYIARVHARPSFAATIARESAAIARARSA